jgi:hypothetical protein
MKRCLFANPARPVGSPDHMRRTLHRKGSAHAEMTEYYLQNTISNLRALKCDRRRGPINGTFEAFERPRP